MTRVTNAIIFVAIAQTAHLTSAFAPPARLRSFRASPLVPRTAVDLEEATATPDAADQNNINAELEETTQKWGVEAGLFKSAQQGNFDQAKLLLKKYGVAYLATSISFAIVSFAICYSLVDSGVDVASILAKVGITVDVGSKAETAGTATIAYIGTS